MDTLAGIPGAACEFYAELEQNNNREWWLAHKDQYHDLVKAPLESALAKLTPAFGSAKMFRPHRDMRFSLDKAPYKTAQGAFVSNYEGVGFYLQLSADGLLLGGGYHSFSPAQLSRYRSAVDATSSGEALVAIIDSLATAGFTIDGEMLKTVPRGFPKDHPRAELLKHKTLNASVRPGRPDWMGTAELTFEVGARWEQLRPLVDWVVRYAAP